MFILTITTCYDSLIDHITIIIWISAVEENGMCNQKSGNGFKFPVYRNACNLFILPSQLRQITLLFNHVYTLVENVWLYTKPLDFFACNVLLF